ncbi:hypothetical protein AVEN_86505-1, partial [Araneus ventricosus]
TSKIYEILVDIQSTLKDLKAEVAENSKKIDHLQTFLPQPWSWKSAKNDFNFPVSTEEQLLELEKQLENNEMATKLLQEHFACKEQYIVFHEEFKLLISIVKIFDITISVLIFYLECIGGKTKRFHPKAQKKATVPD